MPFLLRLLHCLVNQNTNIKDISSCNKLFYKVQIFSRKSPDGTDDFPVTRRLDPNIKSY